MENFFTRSVVVIKPDSTIRKTTRISVNKTWANTQTKVRGFDGVIMEDIPPHNTDYKLYELEEVRLLQNASKFFISTDYKGKRLRVKYDQGQAVEMRITERKDGIVQTIKDFTPKLRQCKDPNGLAEKALEELAFLTS